MNGFICPGCGAGRSSSQKTCGAWRCIQRVAAAEAAREAPAPSKGDKASRDKRKLALLELGDEELVAQVRKVFALGDSWRPRFPLSQKERQRFRSSLVLGIDLGWH